MKAQFKATMDECVRKETKLTSSELSESIARAEGARAGNGNGEGGMAGQNEGARGD